MTYGKLCLLALAIIATLGVVLRLATNPSEVKRWIASTATTTEFRQTPPLPAWQGGPETQAERAERGARAKWFRDSETPEARAARAAHARDHFGRYGRKIPAKQPPVVSLIGDDLKPVGE